MDFLLLTVLCQMMSIAGVSWAAEASAGSGSGSSGSFNGGTLAVLASVGVVGAGFMIVFVCAFSWWRRQYRKLCPVKPPPDDDVTFPPRLENGNNNVIFMNTVGGPMRPLDANSLDSDSRVTIEPFPSLETMIYETNRAILTSDDDPNIYAHDWFENQTLSYPRTNLSFMQELGTGWFGLVIESEAKDILANSQRSKVTVEVLRDEAGQREQMRFLDQSRVYRDSNNKNVMKILGHCIETMPYMLIFENFPKGDLKSYLQQHSRGPVLLDSQGANARNKMALDIANGLDWMHGHGFTHPDLAARNCLVTLDGGVVIGDHGLAKTHYRDDYYWGSGVSGGSGRDVGLAIRWAAPESIVVSATSITTHKTTIAANVWSFGVVLWEICELSKFPYAELSDEQVLSRVITDKNYTLKSPSISQMPYVTLRDKLSKIMNTCWHGIPSKRPEMSHIVELLNTPL